MGATKPYESDQRAGLLAHARFEEFQDDVHQVGGLMSWARGEQDPDWKKKGGAKQQQPPRP